MWDESKVVDGKVQTDLRDLDELHELADDLVRLTGLVTMINIAQQGHAKTQTHALKPDFNETTSKSSGSIAGISNLNGNLYMLMHTQITPYTSSDYDARINQAIMSGFLALFETLQTMATINIG